MCSVLSFGESMLLACSVHGQMSVVCAGCHTYVLAQVSLSQQQTTHGQHGASGFWKFKQDTPLRAHCTHLIRTAALLQQDWHGRQSKRLCHTAHVQLANAMAHTSTARLKLQGQSFERGRESCIIILSESACVTAAKLELQ
jgi:hypothetical protein